MVNQDKTFCTNKKCELTQCERHHCHIDWSVAPPWRSYAEFDGTKYCLLHRKEMRDEKVY